ncbi:hypothetical protein HOLleu_44317 [Holothuria leucospilota]|uniref:Uncharacterized protein n=1 Tax=Holothuria leucospilota TaxID=206669 RepID=A0A9Q1BAZ0_HOLLE|nr:hypothetical protein HOLleu_44317 [Holothuria leucospilota]
MFKPSCKSDVANWDKYVSQFELIYGRKVRGLFDILKEGWTQVETDDCTVIPYVLEMRSGGKATKEMENNVSLAQQKQKSSYDKTARTRSLQAGDKVLVLLPASSNKLQAE